MYVEVVWMVIDSFVSIFLDLVRMGVLEVFCAVWEWVESELDFEECCVGMRSDLVGVCMDRWFVWDIVFDFIFRIILRYYFSLLEFRCIFGE